MPNPDLAPLQVCTGCLACIDTCPVSALSPIINDEGHLFYQVNTDLCVCCHKCETVCPIVSNMEYGENSLSASIPYAAWAKNEEIRRVAPSGGLFGAVAAYVISHQGVAIGASWDGFQVQHIAVSNCNEIHKLQGSKYVQSNTMGIYKLVKQLLDNNQLVLFSGLGCQVAALLSFIGKHKNIERLITIDIICGGIPSSFLVSKYVENSDIQIKAINNFRNKRRYEFSVVGKDNAIRVIPLSDRPLPLCGFYSELTNRNICYNCRFSFAHRLSDMTIGDLWGSIDKFSDEYKKGVSMVVTHTQKARELLLNADIYSEEIAWDDCLFTNPRMVYGKLILGQFSARKNLSYAFKHYPYNKILEIYANKVPKWRFDLMLRKVVYYVIHLLIKLYRYRIIKRILRNNKSL